MNDEPDAIGITPKDDRFYVAPVRKVKGEYVYLAGYRGSNCLSPRSARRLSTIWSRRLGVTKVVVLNPDIGPIVLLKS